MGVEGLVLIAETVNAEKYQKVLDYNIMASIQKIFSCAESAIFQGGSAPRYRAKKVKLDLFYFQFFHITLNIEN